MLDERHGREPGERFNGGPGGRAGAGSKIEQTFWRKIGETLLNRRERGAGRGKSRRHSGSQIGEKPGLIQQRRNRSTACPVSGGKAFGPFGK